MSKVPNSFLPPLNALNNNNNVKKTDTSSFDSLFNSNVSLGNYADDLLSSLTSQNDNWGANDIMNAVFPFSSSFESTFGLTGPLPNYINTLTQSLKLTKDQNLALQDIAVRNKDITKTPENVEKISIELKKAGIGA